MKEQYITLMQGMSDGVTIFPASREFWGKVFDNIEKSEVLEVDESWFNAYSILTKVNQLFHLINRQNGVSHFYSHAFKDEIKRREMRLLLFALEHRLNGKKVTIIAANSRDLVKLEQGYAFLVEMLPHEMLDHEYTDKNGHISQGNLNFMIYKSEGFNWHERRYIGTTQDHIHLISPYSVLEHYGEYLKVFEQFANLHDLTPFVVNAEYFLFNGV